MTKEKVSDSGMGDVVSIFPANDFKVVANNAGEAIEVGIIIGYAPDGGLTIFAGGLLDGKQPTGKDWLWMIETFKAKMLNGDYAEG